MEEPVQAQCSCSQEPLASGYEINPLAADYRFVGDSDLGSIGRLPQRPDDLDGDGFDDVMTPVIMPIHIQDW